MYLNTGFTLFITSHTNHAPEHPDCLVDLQGEIVLSIIAFITVATQRRHPSGQTHGLKRDGFHVWFGRTWSGLHNTVTPTPSYTSGMERNVDCGCELITQHQWQTLTLQAEEWRCYRRIFMDFKLKVKHGHMGVVIWPCSVFSCSSQLSLGTFMSFIRIYL